jgi:proteasome lid subunit RPN8/RPN11
MKLQQKANDAINAEALARFPHECCGVINKKGDFVPLQNAHPDPAKNFQFDAGELVRHEARAIIHSHCLSRNHPSLLDCERWEASGLVWGIVSCDGENVSDIFWMDDDNPQPLEGREWVYGFHDCGAIIRDWYWIERKVRIPNFKRDATWTGNEVHKDLYTHIITAAGFYEVPLSDLQRGDVLLMSLVGPHTHHAAVYLGDGKILHQLHATHGRHLSGVHDLHGMWDKCVRKAVRYGKPKRTKKVKQ